ncbi:arsenate reductase (glutaredoxin) [Corynebacterium felinum]|uniref:Arsenate reductase n=1 Tax=Corynebacterium felinum TaxID=131318 RepID=A0ABU2B9C3_9CORY|nr:MULTISPECIES: arsenate reductase (glutaredoxin) [Corynebacterium]MDF5821263.1 arsenate reductase (glutaredoxin) [Corynebacterium felinum]MDO4761320.1 arsenate reductase (glutaredoxin) [Corynebacterium sp.]MDR7355217.1 arsenate reductase [Corynebacterium felinum]WJY94568.1 Arsenate reductase [Corynebacterium felinum]
MVTVYHNPRCSKSRAAVAFVVEQLGEANVTIVRYLQSPPTADELRELLRRANLRAHDAIRTGEAVYAELGLNQSCSEDELIAAMVSHPILIERPFVVSDKGVVLARPTEKIAEVL